MMLQAERLDGREKRRHRLPIDELPDGACIVMPGNDEQAAMLRGGKLLRWTSKGYVPAGRRPRGEVDVLTPPSILAVLKAGYRAAPRGILEHVVPKPVPTFDHALELARLRG